MLLTNEKVVVDWVSNAEARLKLRVGPSPSVESFYMFAYTDHFRTSLYGIWRVLVHAQSG